MKTIAVLRLSGEILNPVYGILKEAKLKAEDNVKSFEPGTAEFDEAYKAFKELKTACAEIEATS